MTLYPFQTYALAALAFSDGSTVAQVATAAELLPKTAASALNTLRALGLAYSRRPGSSRRNRWTLTPQGRETLRAKIDP